MSKRNKAASRRGVTEVIALEDDSLARHDPERLVHAIFPSDDL